MKFNNYFANEIVLTPDGRFGGNHMVRTTARECGNTLSTRQANSETLIFVDQNRAPGTRSHGAHGTRSNGTRPMGRAHGSRPMGRGPGPGPRPMVQGPLRVKK